MFLFYRKNTGKSSVFNDFNGFFACFYSLHCDAFYYLIPLEFPLYFRPAQKDGKFFRCQRQSRFCPFSRPTKMSLFEPLEQKPKTVAVPKQDFDPVAVPVAEREQRAAEQIGAKALFHDRRKAVDGLPHVGASARKIYLLPI
jgi:hypothetical protein